MQLDNLYFVGDLTNDRLRLLPTIVDGRPNPDAAAPRRQRRALPARAPRRARRRGGAGSASWPHRAGSRPSSCSTRAEHVAGDLLHLQPRPVRRGGAGLSSTPACGSPTDEERDADPARSPTPASAGCSTRRPRRCSATPQFIAQLEAGFAPHHAGMVPPFKEVVEACFIEGLVKVVFATETLAVGINMPARSVVIEKLTKFTGDHHETAHARPVHPADRPRRAARHRRATARGRAVEPVRARSTQVAELAVSKSFHLRSAFRPTYNMAANLVRTYDATTARQLLTCRSPSSRPTATSCASRRRLQRQRERLAELRDGGDEPVRRHRGVPRGRSARRASRVGRDDPIELAMLRAAAGRRRSTPRRASTTGRWRWWPRAHRKGGLRLTTITPAAHSIQLDGADFGDAAASSSGSVDAARRRTPRTATTTGARSAGGCEHAKLAPRGRDAGGRRPTRAPRVDTRSGMHPVEDDPDLQAAAAGRRAGRPGASARSPSSRRRVLHRNATLAQRVRRRAGACCPTCGYVDRGGVEPHRRRARCSPGCSTRAICWSPRRCGRAARRSRRRRPGRAGVDVRVRAPGARRPAAAVVPVRRRPRPLAQHRAAQRGPAVHRAAARARRASPARADVLRRRLRLGGGRGLRRGGRRGGAHRRRLRPDGEAADRPARPDRDRGARSRRPGATARQAADACFRGVVADASSSATVGRRRRER